LKATVEQWNPYRVSHPRIADADDLPEVIRSIVGEKASLTLKQGSWTVMLSVDGAKWTAAAEGPRDSAYAFRSGDEGTERVSMIIGGQGTDIEQMYVFDRDVAIELVEEFFRARQVSGSRWEELG